MKTSIPQQINDMNEVRSFLKALYDNGESYHPEDPAADIIGNDDKALFTKEEADKLDATMTRIYEICDANKQDPCEIILNF